MSAALTGSLLAISRWYRSDVSLAVRDPTLATRLPLGVTREANDVRSLAYADPYIAYHAGPPATQGASIAFDRAAGWSRAPSRYDPWTSGQGWTVTFQGRIAMTSDGTLTAVVSDADVVRRRERAAPRVHRWLLSAATMLRAGMVAAVLD